MKARQIVHGLGWSTLATLINVLAQFAFMAVLARHVEPAAFGLVLMANIALRFVSFFAQMGTTQSLIQRASIDTAYTTAALVVAVSVSTLLYAVVSAAAPLFTWYFKASELPAVLWTYGAMLPLSALSGPPLALLRREGRFRTVSTIEVTSYVIGYGVTGVICSLLDLGVWSLVAATLVQQTLLVALAYSANRYPLQWPVQRTALHQVFSAGSRYSSISFLEFLWANVESLLIGRWLGSGALGLFNRAQMLANLPIEQAVSSVNKVMFPALSAMQLDRGRMADGFLVLLVASGTISGMLSAGIAASAADVVALMLGRQWDGAVPVVIALSLGVPAMFIYTVCGITFDSLGTLDVKLKLQAALLVLKFASIALLWNQGLPTIALAVASAEYLRTFGGLWLILRVLPVQRDALARSLGGVVLSAAAAYIAVRSASAVGTAQAWPLLLRLAFDTVAGLLAAIIVGVLMVRRGASFSPLARFETLRRWHADAYQFIFRSPATR